MPLLLSCTLLAPFERGSGKAVRIRSNSSAVHHGYLRPVMVRTERGEKRSPDPDWVSKLSSEKRNAAQ